MAESFIKIGDQKFDVTDLTLNECEELEEYTGETIASGELQSAKAIKYVIYLFLKRKNPDVTVAEAGEMTLATFAGDDAVNPTEAEPSE